MMKAYHTSPTRGEMPAGQRGGRGRFAPSPTGRMHLGNVFSALLSWLSVKSKGGKWLLRIEDIDPQRSKQQYADQIMEDLEWLGLTWDEGPYYQSERGEIYEEYLEKLRQQDLLYLSYKTRAERLAVSAPQEDSPLTNSPLIPSFPEGQKLLERGEQLQDVSQSSLQKENAYSSSNSLHPLNISQKGDTYSSPLSKRGAGGESAGGESGAITLRVSDEIITYQDQHYGEQTINIKEDIGDFIVRRRDGAWAYQLAVVVDDALMGVTEVVRGRDLLQSAGQQIYLGGLLGFPRMEYAHLPLLCNEAGQRLSKRDKSMDLGQLREHYSAEEIIGKLAVLAHLIEEKKEPCLDDQARFCCKPQDLVPLL
ncbi:MAG: tRNA glutamyl-Q(34) synthetase GluQRS, partial [Prevotella sp.]|nr:tRNA glutamyl-Q(34) synthetase GluQRS [Prevotella sp.]